MRSVFHADFTLGKYSLVMIFRKAWLRLILGLMVIGFALWGCGGSSGEDLQLPPPLPYAVQEEAAQAVRDELSTSGITVENFADKVDGFVAAMRATGKFSEVGFDNGESRQIWMTLPDGVLFVIPFDRSPAGTPPPDSRFENLTGRAPNGFPGASKSALLYTFLDPSYLNATGAVRPYLAEPGYTQVTEGAGFLDGTLDDFEKLQDVGLLYIDGHGVELFPTTPLNPGRKQWLYLATSTERSADVSEEHQQDFQTKRLIFGFEPKNGKATVLMSHLFVKDYVKVGSKSLVFINTCYNGRSSLMADAFIANGAGTVLGWSRRVEDDDAYGSGLFFFDKLIGLRELIPNAHGPTDPNWPSLISETYAAMQSAKRPGLNYEFDTDKFGAKLRMFTASDSPAMIRPSIRNVTYDSDKALITLYGRFGTSPGVVIGNPDSTGVNLPIKFWSDSEIRVDYVSGVTEVAVDNSSFVSNRATLPLGEFTFAEESIPNGQFQILVSHVDIPKHPLARGAMGVTLIVDGADKFRYVVGFPVASAALPLTHTLTANALAPSSNIVTSLDSGTYNYPSLYQGYPLIYDCGDRLVVVINRVGYGGNTGWTLADAQASLHNYTDRVKLRITKSLFDPVNSSTTFVAP